MSESTSEGTLQLPPGVAVTGPIRPGYDAVLSPSALAFVADLARTFGPRVRELLALRTKRTTLDFLPETKAVREGDWTVAPLPADLLD